MKTPLWSEVRLAAAQRKHPQLTFAAWSAAVEHLHRPAGDCQSVVAEAAVAYPTPVRTASAAAGKGTGAVGQGLSLTTNQSERVQQDTEACVVAREPLPASFSPYDFLYRFYRGCVALSVIDESHNGRGRDTDIAHSHHQAMLASQTRLLTSGTHFGGDILGFYYYWFRYHPQFWKRLGLGWNDAEKALSRYGVIQEWTKEYESDARKGSGQTNVQVSTIPAPGLSAKLIPYLLEDMVYLTVLDVGAHMPPRIEIPEIVPIRDPEIADALFEAEQARKDAASLLQEFTNMHVHDSRDPAVAKEQERLERVARGAGERERAVQEWAMPRHLASHYGRLVRSLDDLARRRNTAARLAKGTVPRWFAVLPCDQPFQVWETQRDRWGDTQGRALLVETERLAWDYVYPLERRLIALVQQELSEGRRVMLYQEQNDLRSMARRLERVLKEALQAQRLQPWTLPNSVAAEDRQQAILQAVQRGHRVVIVPYRRVNEGLNLQSAIDTVIWFEMALNLFMLDQASRRAWRLGKREEVRIYYMAYANTAGHTKLRKLGQQSGAAAAFAGEPARGALISHAGADKTTLARLSSLLEQREEEDDNEESQTILAGEGEVAEEEAALKSVFAQRAEELRTALARGREWLGGIQDDLAERLAVLAAGSPASGSVWAERPLPVVLSCMRTYTEVQGEACQPRENTKRAVVDALPVLPSSQTLAVAHSSAVPDEAAPAPLPAASLQEPAPVQVVGSRAEVVFGRDEHIARARVGSRPRRSGSSRDPLRRHPPLSERDIPSLPEGEEEAGGQSQQVAMPSLWDLLVAPTSGATRASPALVAVSSRGGSTPEQPHLWE